MKWNHLYISKVVKQELNLFTCSFSACFRAYSAAVNPKVSNCVDVSKACPPNTFISSSSRNWYTLCCLNSALFFRDEVNVCGVHPGKFSISSLKFKAIKIQP
ncbi:hypothetical protein DsansV1_C11g0107091 [Dioscorea sansibarensis]